MPPPNEEGPGATNTEAHGTHEGLSFMSTTPPQVGGQVVRFKASTETATKFKFTRDRIERAMKPLRRLGRPFFLRDTEVPGLCLRWQSETAQTFLLEKRYDHRLWRVTLGEYTPKVDLEAIRAAARNALHKLHTGTLEAEVQARKAAEDPALRRLSSLSVLDAVEDYAAANDIRGSTAANYRIAAQRVSNANKATLKGKPLLQWTGDEVRAAFDDLTREVKPHTATGYMRALHAVVEGWRHRWPKGMVPMENVIAAGTMEGNRSKKVVAPPRTRSLKAKETLPFITTAGTTAATTKPTRAGVFRLLQLLALTGMRFEELAALKWSEVDLQDAVIRLGADRVKTGKPFDKPLGKKAVEVLKAQLAASGGGTYVFPSPTRPDVHVDDARKAIAKVCTDAAVTMITPHDLRRTFLRAAEAAGLPPSRVKSLVHHAVGKDVTAGYIGDGFNDDPHSDAQKAEDFLLAART